MSRGSDFWTRRKAKVLEEEAQERRREDAQSEAAREADLAERTDAEILDELGLPDPDTLKPGDDFRAFMARAVPDRIRSRALRRLWLSNPALANLDGLIDYGEDFTDSAKVIENMQTIYQVGRGMVDYAKDLAAEADAADGAEDGAPDPDDAAPAHGRAETAGSDQIDAPVDVEILENADEAGEDEAETFAALPRRRMQFTFDAAAGDDA